ncbi:hypothetical protein [Bradyrhizobium sp. AUGA SZCCT0160]|uniref:hypothetical protein n=1 Tax=Bradyrhizobium sp. AUGA SZCCT0160 TaxID=2807662 RepID=UPI001BA5E476|nr:hypothetical protein [Bradyrhizobium sp. AUGA SZCCT0160]MBR1193975.1 hypothetical protein [Bradyrhizobium sp. AUGA SZCCT0160]
MKKRNALTLQGASANRLGGPVLLEAKFTRVSANIQSPVLRCVALARQIERANYRIADQMRAALEGMQ